MKRKYVTRAVPFDLLDYYLSFRPEVNILFDQYNFPDEYCVKDFITSIYQTELEQNEDIKDIYMPSFSNIPQCSSNDFRIDFLEELEKHVGRELTGYRITGSNITPGLQTVMYRVDVYAKDESSKNIKLYNGLFAPNTFTPEDNSNISFQNIRKVSAPIEEEIYE